MATKKALGKGLGALIGAGTISNSPQSGMVGASMPTISPVEEGEVIREIPAHFITTGAHQPRKNFSQEELQELADSIRSMGILQPLLVRQVGDETYELIAGERRWRAAQMIGMKEVPVIVRRATDLEVFEWAMVENLQRADLNPIEEAEGYATLMIKFNLSQEDVAKKVGKNRATVANSLRLRNLTPEVQDYIRKGHLSVGHAKVILSLSEPKAQDTAATQVIKKGLSVRQTEHLVAHFLGHATKRKRSASSASVGADWRDLELRLQRALGTRVRLVGTADRGHLEIEFYNSSDLERILSQLGVQNES